MKIDKITFRNFGSYGNRTLVLPIPEDPSFFLVQGKNGHGKCFLPDTRLKILLEKEDFEKFEVFLELYRQRNNGNGKNF